MPINDKKNLKDQIPHGEHLTLFDTMRASFMPAVDRNEAGQAVNPKEDFLRQQALMRKKAADKSK